MATKPQPEIPYRLRFELDQVNKILLLRVEGRLTDESFKECYWAVRLYSIETDANVGIWDLSSVTEFALSPEFLRDLAYREAAMPDSTKRPRFFVAPTGFGLGIARVYEIMASPMNPLLKIVFSVDEALTELGVQYPRFEPFK